MKRSRLNRSAEVARAFQDRGRAPLARSAPPKRRKRLAARGKKAPQRFERAFLSREYVEFVHSLGCAVTNCDRVDIQCAHVGRPRSRGGRWWEIAPLCGSRERPGHHQEQEKRTPWFNAKYGIDLESVAAATALRWKQKTRTLA